MPTIIRRKKRVRTPNALNWAQEFLPHYFTEASAAFHEELLRDVEDESKRLIARVAPRGHGKSVLASFAFPLWCVCERKRQNIVILTHEAGLATQFVRDMRSELESNQLILDAYGDLCADATDETKNAERKRKSKSASRKNASSKSKVQWTQEKFTTTTGVTVQAKCVGASFRGVRVGPARPDLIVCDDIEKDEHLDSPEGRRKVEHWLRRVVMPALAPDGRLLILGSLLHYDSLLANLANREKWPRWDYKVYRAMEASENNGDGLTQEVLWPARWPLEKLKEERERIGTLAFEQEYQANPIDDETRIFRPEWLKRYDPAELADLENQNRLFNLVCIDPATGVDGGDFFALWAGSVDRITGTIYTRELSLERIGFVQQVERIVEAFRRWRPMKIGIETNAYQHSLKQALDDRSGRTREYLPIVGIQTIANKHARIESSSAFYENGTFRLPPVLSPEAESQFLHYPRGGKDDAPDVCAMAIELARTTCTHGRAIGIVKRNPNPFAKANW